jgi:hypothetical protein
MIIQAILFIYCKFIYDGFWALENGFQMDLNNKIGIRVSLILVHEI